jgi:hypothetical protein
MSCHFHISKKYIVSYKHTWRVRWDYMIMVFAIINSFKIPYDFAFIHDSGFWDVMDFMID